MNTNSNIDIKFPKIIFLDNSEKQSIAQNEKPSTIPTTMQNDNLKTDLQLNQPENKIIIDYVMEPKKNISARDSFLNLSNVPPCVKELAESSTILSAAFIYHYFMGSPKNEHNPIVTSIANFVINSIAEYLPKSIAENCQIEMETFNNNNNSETIYREDIKNYIKKILDSVNQYFTDVKNITKKFQNKKIQITSELLLSELCKNNCESIYYPEITINDKILKNRKASKLSKMLLKKLKQLSFENNKMHKIMMLISSMISNITPLIVTTLDNYLTPYTISIMLKRALVVLTETTEKMKNVNKNINKKTKKNNSEESNISIGLKEKELVKQYGKTVNEISKTIISCLNLSISAKVLAGSAKLGMTAFSNVIGVAICNALNPSVQSDLDKIKFFFQLFFKESTNIIDTKTSPDPNSNSNFNINNGEEFCGVMKEVLKLEKAIVPIGDNISETILTTNFYEEFATSITNLITNISNFAGKVSKQIVDALVKFLRISFENQELLNVIIYDYVLPNIFN